MPALANLLSQQIQLAHQLAQSGEAVLSHPQWTLSRVEFLYELAFLRMFGDWERFLEMTFLRYLCGYQSSHGVCIPVAGARYFGTLSAATLALFGPRGFALWHDPNSVVRRAQTY